MDQQPKQARSKKRIEAILETAENILLETGVDDITIAGSSAFPLISTWGVSITAEMEKPSSVWESKDRNTMKQKIMNFKFLFICIL